MESKSIDVAHADAKVARIHNIPDMFPNDARKFCEPIKSAVVCVDWNVPSTFHAAL